MRRLIVLVALLLFLVPFVYAQTTTTTATTTTTTATTTSTTGTATTTTTSSTTSTTVSDGCGDGDMDQGEECDFASDPSGCSTGSTCNANCICEKEVNFVLFDLTLGHNMLFSKVMDLLHIIKEALFQLEIKTIEIQLTDFECNQQPVSFWIPADISPYGKLNEIDALIRLLIKAINDGGPLNFGSPNLAGADTKLDDAECLIGLDQFKNAFNCKCLAYREDLLGLDDESGVVCNDCTD